MVETATGLSLQPSQGAVGKKGGSSSDTPVSDRDLVSATSFLQVGMIKRRRELDGLQSKQGSIVEHGG